MVMHTIRVTYDPTTRRMSLADRDTYGGATTDVNSVNISFTGIVPEGNDFIARVDFAVPVRVSDHVIDHPFILLEQDNEEWNAVIPNAVLAAAGETKRLPFQLILANDSQVINSRNTIILEVTAGIDSTIPGDELPEYEMPEWPVPTGTSYSADVWTVDTVYDPTTRTLTLSGNDPYGGATVDTFSVRINVTGVPDTANLNARLDFAVPIRTEDNVVIRPFVVLEKVNSTWCAMVPQAVLMASKEVKKLPFQLVLRHGDVVINSRNSIVLETTRAINAMESYISNYAPYVMYRNDTWGWIENFTYGLGSVVTKNGEIYVSLTDDNLGHDPEGPDGAQYWELKGNGAPPGGEPWQILRAGPSDNPLGPVWVTVSETHIVTTTANTDLEIEHQFGDRAVSCTFFENGEKVDVPYTCGDGSIYIETTSAHTLTVVITALPSEAII